MTTQNLSHPATLSGGIEPLPPRRKWRAITVATMILVPAFWAILAGLVSTASKNNHAGPNPAAAIALGLALVPFVFLVTAFMSEHPRAPSAVLKAMGLAVLVGIPVSAVAGDAVTGMVAGIGAGGICALRSDAAHSWRARAVAVTVAAVYTFVLIRTIGAPALLVAPVFPLTGIGIADHISEWRVQRQVPAGGA